MIPTVGLDVAWWGGGGGVRVSFTTSGRLLLREEKRKGIEVGVYGPAVLGDTRISTQRVPSRKPKKIGLVLEI